MNTTNAGTIESVIPFFPRDLQSIVGEYLVGDEFDEPLIETLASNHLENETYLFLNNMNVNWTLRCVKKLIQTKNKSLILSTFPTIGFQTQCYQNLSLFTGSEEMYLIGLQLGLVKTIVCLLEAIRKECDLLFFKKLYDSFELSVELDQPTIDRVIETCVSNGSVEKLKYVLEKEGITTFKFSMFKLFTAYTIEMQIFVYNNTDIKYTPDSVIRLELVMFLMKWLPESVTEFMEMYPEVVNSESLCQACCWNNMQLVKYILNSKPGLIDSIEYEIEEICNVANEDMIRFLYDQGVEFTIESIMRCFVNTHHELAFFLYDNTNAGTIEDLAFPGEMANSGYLNVLKWIHEKNIIQIDWMGCLMNSIDGNHLECTRWILETHNMDRVSLQDSFDIACENGKLDSVILLHERSSLLATEQNFIVSAEEGHLDVVKFLTSKGQPACKNGSPLEQAITFHQKDVIEWLCNNRLDDNDPHPSTINYLIQSNTCFDETLVRLLAKRAPYKINGSAVRHVIQINNTGLLQFIVENEPGMINTTHLIECKSKACLRVLLMSNIFTLEQLSKINQNYILEGIIKTFIKNRMNLE
jgi:hypothetical protein